MTNSNTKIDVHQHQQHFLAKAKSRTTTITVEIRNIDIVVNPGVFPPATDTKLLASSVNLEKGDYIIDVTSGSGVVAVIAGLQGATGYAIDINPVAVANSKENILKHKVNIKAIESDLFTAVPEGRFDYIFANGPFFEGKIIDPMDYACYGARKFTDDLLSALPTRLKPDGKLYMVVSAAADLDYLVNKIVENNLRAEIHLTRYSNDGQRKYLLYVISLK